MATDSRGEPRLAESSTDRSSGDIQAVSRVCRMLDLLASESRLHPAEVVDRLGLQRSTVHRYLSSLLREGYLKKDPDGAYVPGPALLQLGIATTGSSSPVDVAGPYMRRLTEQVHQTVVLSLWGGDAPVVSRVEEDDSRLVHVSVRVGSVLPLDAAQAQVFLTFMSDRRVVDRLLERLPLRARRDLETQMDHARRQGFAVNSVVVDGIRAVAAPVFGRDGAIEATLAVVGTVNSIPVQPESSVVAALVDTAEELSRGRRYGADAGPRLEESA